MIPLKSVTLIYNPLSDQGDHMERWNQGERQQPQPEQPSLLERTINSKLATLEQLQAIAPALVIRSTATLTPDAIGTVGGLQCTLSPGWNRPQHLHIQLAGVPLGLAEQILELLEANP